MTRLSHHGGVEIDSDNGVGGELMGGDTGVVMLALGNAWYHSINTRLLLTPMGRSQREVCVHMVLA